MPLTRTPDILDIFVTALTSKTVAGARVFNPRSWPTALGEMPVIIIKAPAERKTSQGPNGVAFDVVSTIRVVGRITFKAEPDDAAAAQALIALGLFQQQIEVAVINYGPLYKIVSEIESVEVQSEVKSEGAQPMAELTMDFACKFYQGAEWFYQAPLVDISEFAVYGDLLNIFDATGTYTPPMDYDPTTPPRTEGPDGRVEIGAITQIPQ